MENNLKIVVAAISGDTQVVKFDGDFDKAGQSAIKGDLEALIKALEVKTLVFDFAALDFINSQGIGYLMDINNHLKEAGKELNIKSPKANVMDVFKAIGLPDVIPVK